jgi:integrase
LLDAAAATVDRELEVLRHLFNLAERWNKFFGKNPVSRSGLLHPVNQKERILSLEEENRLLIACDSYIRSIIIAALYTGMRKGEILSLKWDNIDLNNSLIVIDQTNAKSKKSRRIPINSVVRKLLLEQKLKSAGSEYVFLSSKGTPYMRQDSLNKAYLLALKKANIKGLRFHDLRHTAATRVIELGCSIVAVKEILGHASINTTMRYVHPNDSLRTELEGLTSYFSDSLGHKSSHSDNQQQIGDDVTH